MRCKMTCEEWILRIQYYFLEDGYYFPTPLAKHCLITKTIAHKVGDNFIHIKVVDV
jgi:hypothetical protein